MCESVLEIAKAIWCLEAQDREQWASELLEEPEADREKVRKRM